MRDGLVDVAERVEVQLGMKQTEGLSARVPFQSFPIRCMFEKEKRQLDIRELIQPNWFDDVLM